jgi:hypothetical protein
MHTTSGFITSIFGRAQQDRRRNPAPHLRNALRPLRKDEPVQRHRLDRPEAGLAVLLAGPGVNVLVPQSFRRGGPAGHRLELRPKLRPATECIASAHPLRPPPPIRR